ncbi:hypothetical protein FJZ39_02365 [Candidatus Saccharibacteria bacterium]|nr:hypothetical protein [Candidatus Saccharibacteria bacterium]
MSLTLSTTKLHLRATQETREVVKQAIDAVVVSSFDRILGGGIVMMADTRTGLAENIGLVVPDMKPGMHPNEFPEATHNNVSIRQFTSALWNLEHSGPQHATYYPAGLQASTQVRYRIRFRRVNSGTPLDPDRWYRLDLLRA